MHQARKHVHFLLELFDRLVAVLIRAPNANFLEREKLTRVAVER
jgi:hypothetical protein